MLPPSVLLGHHVPSFNCTCSSAWQERAQEGLGLSPRPRGTQRRYTVVYKAEFADDDFVIVNNTRACKLEKPLVAYIADEPRQEELCEPPAVLERVRSVSQEAWPQEFGTRPAASAASRPQTERTRKSNKIAQANDEVVDDEAVKEMPKGYDTKADNATDINLNGNGRLIGEG